MYQTKYAPIDNKIKTVDLGDIVVVSRRDALSAEKNDEQRHGQCCIYYTKYPDNLPLKDVANRRLRVRSSQLEEHADRLFSKQKKAQVLFWDKPWDDVDFMELERVENLSKVEELCPVGKNINPFGNPYTALQARYIFLYSRNTRSKIFTTREMLTYILSYHQVRPWFIEFLLPFGQQIEAQDARFSAFRSKTYFEPDTALALRELNRSGHEFHVGYNLGAPERTTNSPLQWSVRQTAIYHSFDVESYQAFWIVLKGNNSMAETLCQETKEMSWNGPDEDSRKRNSFLASLDTHLVVCSWSCENWRPYINYLEDELNRLTRSAVTTSEIGKPPSPPPREQTEQTPSKHRSGRPFAKLAFMRSLRHRSHSDDVEDASEKLQREILRQNLNAPVPASDSELEDRPPYHHFEMVDLQHAQLVGEKINDALSIVRKDIKILDALRDFYSLLPKSDIDDQRAVDQFRESIKDITTDLQLFEASFEALQSLFESRKQLFSDILEYQNTQANERIATKTQRSTDQMQRMTEEMKLLAQITKQETMSMSIIAGVTMFFLPGTFVSTLMSTDIVKWEQRPDGSFTRLAPPGARNLFLQLTLPLMFATFVALFCYTHWRNLHGKKSKVRLP